MNEAKRKELEYYNRSNKKQDCWEEIVVLMQAFINSCTNMSATDRVALGDMINTLNKQKATMSKVVMRSMQKRFEAIKEKYSNQK